MADLTAEQIAQRAFDTNVLTDRELAGVWAQFGSRNVPAEDFKQLLLRRELLTNYQIDRLLRGERDGYFYGDYKVLYLVGSGTFARVYRAVNQRTGEVRAVKVMRKRLCESPENREKFALEGEVGLSLRHPNIVPIYEVGHEGIQTYLVMEFLEGRNLREFIRIRKKFEPLDATRILADVARGLDYALQKGLSHRDLKTSNVFVTSSGIAKVVDFGLAGADRNVSDEALADMANPRTVDYATLERATGARKDDPRSDIYFIGCIYYHALTGLPPLEETRDRSQRSNALRFTNVVPIEQAAPELPRAVTQIVNRAMELDPTMRYQTPGEMLADLTLLIQRLAGGAVPDTHVIPAGPGARQRSLMFVESNVQLQDIVRERLKQAGYRVLVTSDPQRPQDSFTDQDRPADVVVFSTGDLGEKALNAFNQFGQSDWTEKIPAVLLLGEKQLAWKDQARLADKRVIARMPIRLKEFRELLEKLVPPLPAK